MIIKQRLIFIFLLLTHLTACLSAEPPAWKEVKLDCSLKQLSENKEFKESSDCLIAYLDSSVSMAGFVSTTQETVFSRSLQEIRSLGNDPLVKKVLVRKISLTTGNIESSDVLQQASRNPKFYDATHEDLNTAIELFSQPVEGINSELPAKFHILISDGVQSTKDKRIDTVYIQQSIRQLLEKGWAGAVIGIRSQFDGLIYSEVLAQRRLSASNQNKTKKVSLQKTYFPYETSISNPEKYRPFYMYVFSPDQKSLEALMGKLKEKLNGILSEQNIDATKVDVLRELALTSAYVKSAAEKLPKIKLTKYEDDKLDTDRKKSVDGDIAKFTVWVDLKRAKAENKATLEATINEIPWSESASLLATQSQLSSMLEWSIEPIYPTSESKQRALYPETQLTPSIKPVVNTTTGEVSLSLDIWWPQQLGTPDWRVYCLKAHLKTDNVVPPWIKEWSTREDENPEQTHKTYDLESTLGGLWNNPTLKEQTIVKTYFRVGPR